jgi:2-polyprenyl-3-methyl-5-hydroxy-6-metoxy-1,4-benzoquinol methylase
MKEFSDYFEKQAKRVEEFRIRDGRFYGSSKNLSLRYYLKSKRRYRDSLLLAYPYLKEGGRTILDLGGWEMGVLCRPLASSVLCVALDARVEELQETFEMPVQSFDIMSSVFPLEGRRFDAVFFLEVLEHLPPPVDLVFNRLHGLINPGGILVLSVPNLVFWQKRIKFFFWGRSPLRLSDTRDSHEGYDHIRPYTYDECLGLFRKYGFQVKKLLSGNYQSGWYNYPFHCLERFLPRLAHKLIFLLTPTKEVP